ncbi:MAG: helix-turn-helix domain-containing protein [Erysipelotrichaceae bacterium]|nr:helix-turn-helix domain-containing protein [Erysipelotrichaceae bacterium]
MTPEELKQKLSQITASEEKYRSGIRPDTSAFSFTRINGIDVMEFSYANISSQYNAIPFLVRKHSRFRDYPFHIHDWIEITYMYSGSCVQVIEGKEYRMEEGQLILMAPGTVHTILPLTEDDILVMIALGQKHLTNNFFNRLSSSSIVSNFFINAFNTQSSREPFFLFPSQDDRRLKVFIEEFLCEWYDPSLATLDIQNNIFSLIISELVNIMNDHMTASRIRSRNSYIIPLLRYIEENYKTCTLSDAADAFGLNPNYLSNLLKKHTGSSFNELVSKEKLSAAKRLLDNSDLSVNEIINYVGYQNMSFFYKKFKERYGILPGDYRKHNVRIAS